MVKLVSTGRAAALVALLFSLALEADATPVAYARHVSGHNPLGGVEVDGISVVDLATGTLIRTFPLACVDDFALAPDGSRLFVVCSATRLVTVADATTGGILDSLQLDNEPATVDITPDGTRLLVGGLSAWVIDTDTLQTVTTTPEPAWCRWSVPSDGSLAYVLLGPLGWLYAVNPVDGSIVKTMTVPLPGNLPAAPASFTISPDGRTGGNCKSSRAGVRILRSTSLP